MVDIDAFFLRQWKVDLPSPSGHNHYPGSDRVLRARPLRVVKSDQPALCANGDGRQLRGQLQQLHAGNAGTNDVQLYSILQLLLARALVQGLLQCSISSVVS